MAGQRSFREITLQGWTVKYSCRSNQERLCIADLIDDLDEAQLATASLCEGWDVKTVGAHLVSFLAEETSGLRGWACAVGVRIGQSMSWRAVERSCQLPKSRQLCASSLITHTGGPRRKHLVYWPKSCPIAAASES